MILTKHHAKSVFAASRASLKRCRKLERRVLYSLVFFLLTFKCAFDGRSAEPGVRSFQATSSPLRITPVSEIKQLTPIIDSNNGRLFRISGTVTYYDRKSEELYIQDSSGGICVKVRELRPDVRGGTLVEVEGTASSQTPVSTINAARLMIAGESVLPNAESLSLEHLLSGSKEGIWVETEGIVRSAITRDHAIELIVLAGNSQFAVRLANHHNKPFPEGLLDAKIRIQGVCSSILNSAKQVVAVQILVPDIKFIRVEEPPPPDPFVLTEQSIDRLIWTNPQAIPPTRVRIKGTVTLHQGQRSIYLNDGKSDIHIATRNDTPLLRPGDLVEAVGYPHLGTVGIGLQEAILRKAGVGTLPLPLEPKVSELLKGDFDSKLVRIEALVLDHGEDGHSQILGCSNDDIYFDALLQNRAGQLPSIPSGSQVSLTGICAVKKADGQQPNSFILLLRTPDDLAILAQPIWLARRDALIGISLAGGLTILLVAWVVTLRRVVTGQAEQIRTRLEHEAALEERYRKIFTNANDFIYTHDLEGRFTSFNPAGQKLLGYTEDEVRALTLAEIIAPAQRSIALQKFQKAEAPCEIPPYETVLVSRAGKSIVVEISSRITSQNGKPFEVEGIARDITERKKAEEALRASEERFSKVFFVSPAAGAISRLRNGSIVDVNDRFLKLFGYERSELIGRTALELGLWTEPNDRLEIIEALANKNSVREKQCRLRTKSGEVRDTLVSAELICFGNEDCVLFITNDITERVKLETQLRQAQKMETIGQLAAGVAHDFNNVLTVIQGNLALAESAPALPEGVSELLKEASQASERAATVTRQLLAFSRKQRIELKTTDLNAIVHDLSKMLQRTLGGNIILECRFQPLLPLIKADTGQLEQVVINLALNGRDAMANGGRMEISTALVNVDQQYLPENPEARTGKFVCLGVSDTGCGMDEKTLSRAFEPFFTTKDIGKGTGLGLSMVHGIVNQHGGWIEIDSKKDHGTTVRLFFPALQADEGSPILEASGLFKDRLSIGHETILLTDDEAPIRNLLTRFLSSKGYCVIPAASGAEALDQFEKQNGKVDLLLTDIMMPGGISGRQLADNLHAKRPHLKIVYMSGHSQDTIDLGFGITEGVNFLAKPFVLETLAKVVREQLDAVDHITN